MKTKLSLVLASLAMAFSVGAGVASTKLDKNIKPVEAAQHADNYSSYTYSGNYYSSAFSTYTEGLNGTLRTNLTTLIHPTSVPQYSSGLATHLQQADADPTNPSNMVYLYTRDSVKKNAASSWNREHVWPKALSNSCWKESRAGADMLHLRPTYSTPNSTRSSYKYGEVTKNSSTLKIYNDMEYGYYANNYFMPLDATKGDVARICMYIWVAYYNEYGSQLPSLTNVFQSFDVLMTWHTNDRPDVLEGNRNNYAEKNVQYNRNPFVDHPEYAWKIFGSQCSQSVLNAAKAAYPDGDPVGITSISKSSATMAVGETTTISATSSNSASITWSSDDESVTVSPTTQSSGSDVTLTAVSEGSATITASVTISGTTYSKTCSVTVTATKQVTSIAISGQKTSYAVDDTFVKPTVTATYNDGTQATVTSDATCSGYNMSSAGNYTVTVSYSYGGATKTTTYEITVSSSGGGSGGIDDYTISTTPLTSSGITNNMLVVWGTSTSNLASSIGSNWVYLSAVGDDTMIFVVEGTSSGFKLKNTSDNTYVASSGAKKVELNSTGTTFTLNSNKCVYNSTSGAFVYNTSGLRPYASGSYTNAYLYALTQNKTLSEIDVSTFPTKMSYTIGEYFDPTGLVITRTYSDSSTDTYAYEGHTSEFTFDPSTSTPLASGMETVEVTYGGESCFFEIELTAAKELSSISISGYTTAFVEGDTFAFGGTVTAHYADASTENVTSSSTFSGYNTTTVGNQTVTVTYKSQTATYQITVSAGTLSSIAVSGQTTTYTRNAAFSFDGTCTATFANGYQKVVTPTSVSSPNMSTTGNKTITVTYTYNGNTRQTTYQITVNSYRTVMEESYSVIGTITYTNDTEEISVETLSTASSGGYSAIDTQYHAWRLGASSKTGTLTVTSSTANIRKIVVNAKYYSNDSGTTFTIDGTSKTLTNSYANYEKEFSTAKSSVALSSVTSGKRVLIASVTVYSYSSQDIGQSEDCIGLETFITNYMHMDYTESLGFCSDSEHHYYSTAKEAFNGLNSHQRSLFTGNSAYTTEWTRLSTWASKNGDSLNGSNQLASGVIQNPVLIFVGSSGNVIAIVSVIALISAVSISGYFFLKKRKDF